MGIRRYPGALPFNSKQEKIFYGREKDINKLLTLIQVEKQVLLYSKSGLGKTSLLEAGVIPKLPAQFIPISIRFYAHTEGAQTPVERVVEALKNKITDFEKRARTVLDELIQDDDRYKTLWYYFKNLQLTNEVNDEKQANNIYLLVFDQFEELFTYPDEQANEFKNQFYELSQSDVPGSIVRLMVKRRRDPENPIENETISLLQQEIDVKTVFAIRSDRLSLLNRLSDKLPDIQLNYHVLYPLDADQTKSAIIKPALDEDEKFETSPFEYDPKAVDKIVSELTKEGSEKLETTQLQIVCQRIEDDVNKKHKSVSSGEKVVVHVKDLPEFSNIFDQFYTDSILKVSKDQQHAAERFIEDELIRNQQRLSLDENICKDYVDEKTLDILVGTHLLRAERNTFQRFSYELSHDTLVEPILESQKKYLEEQAALKAEEERQEELRILKKEQERKEEERQVKIKQQRKLIQWGVVFTIIVVAVGFIAAFKWIDAEDALKELENTQYAKSMQEGSNFMDDADYKNATEKFQNAFSIKNIDSTKILIDKCISLDKNKGKYDLHNDSADYFIKSKEYVLAMKQYNKAINETHYNDDDILKKKKSLLEKVKEIYRKDLSDYKHWGDQEMLEKTQERIDTIQILCNCND